MDYSLYIKLQIFLCLSAKQQDLLTFSKRQNSTFKDNGFQNWRKALQRFDEHEKSEMHNEAAVKLAAKSSTTDVAAQLNTQHKTDQAFHRDMLMKLLSCIKFLARQGLPLRGHVEDTESFNVNLYQLLLLRAEDCPQLLTWLHKREYISPEIVNELIAIMGNTVLRQVLALIKSALWYSLIADEATDISHNEQISISIQWVDSSYEVHEDTLGLFQLPNTKAQTLFTVIKDLLIRCSLPISQCRVKPLMEHLI